jgi:hypothetical protein
VLPSALFDSQSLSPSASCDSQNSLLIMCLQRSVLNELLAVVKVGKTFRAQVGANDLNYLNCRRSCKSLLYPDS